MKEKNKLLIIDDEEFLTKTLRDHFTREGYEVFLAFDGKEGLVKAKEFRPDLILLDIVMPKMDGLEMLKKMKEDLAIDDIPVIVLTNLETSQSVAEALEAGSTGYLVKVNYSVEELSKRIKEVLGNQ